MWKSGTVSKYEDCTQMVFFLFLTNDDDEQN